MMNSTAQLALPSDVLETDFDRVTEQVATAEPQRIPLFQNMSLLQRMARSRVHSWLESIEWGTVDFREADGSVVQNKSRNDAFDSPNCEWIVTSPKLYSRVARGGAMGLAESYMQGEWHTDDLTGLLRILFRHYERQEQFRSTLGALAARLARFTETVLGNTIARSRRQIAAHYDLSNEFFQLFLDPTLMYSSAYFQHPNMSLEEASIAKLDKTCNTLKLSAGQQLLEIGTGWGGFGLHVTERYDLHLTTTTISEEQHHKARQRFDASGRSNRINLLKQDYRELTGQYDRLVSIEMIEAVGERNLEMYFRSCGRLLKPGGRMLIQAIVMPEQRYESYRRGVDFIQKYIFPGGFLPSVSAIQQAVGRTTDFRLAELDDMTTHYARTLLEWRGRFLGALPKVRELGFDDRFIRMWEYYLCYCEAAFREQAVRVVQIAWDRPAL